VNHIRQHVAEIATAATVGLILDHLAPPLGDDPNATDFGVEDF
jgi:hypothetical protein